jgi:hypothetical protein
MKLILLAATAMLAVPALAQTTTTPQAGSEMPATGTPTTADPAQTGDAATMPAPGTPAPMANGSTGTMAQDQTMPAPTTGSTAPNGATPMGGYQPSAPPMSGQAGAGQTVTFQAAPSPSEAYPAPAPLAKYPICKKGQYDKCMQRGGR